MYSMMCFFSELIMCQPLSGMIYMQAATSGIHKSVVAFEPEQSFLDRGKERIEGSIGKLVSKGKMTQEDADKALGSINFTTNIQDLKDTDFIVEAGKSVDECRRQWCLWTRTLY